MSAVVAHLVEKVLRMPKGCSAQGFSHSPRMCFVFFLHCEV